jgi:hypothetical protein
MVLITCKKCGEYRYLTPHAFWNISDLGVKCKNRDTINTITLEEALISISKKREKGREMENKIKTDK